METQTVKGIILTSAPQGEYGRRLQLLTDRLGRITVFAGGAAKTGSHIIGSTRPFTCAEFDLGRGRGAWNLHGVRVIDAFTEIPPDMDASCYGAYFLELTAYVSEEGMPEQEARALLNLLYVTLEALRKKELSPEDIRAILELRILKLQGEYTLTPRLVQQEEASQVNLLWQHVLNSSLTGLYNPARIPELSASSAVRESFRHNAGTLFRRQIPHHFRSLDILQEMTF